MLNFSTLRLPFTVAQVGDPVEPQLGHRDLDPVSLDGVWPTIGRPGSAAIRGSGLPGSTVPGLSGATVPGLSGAVVPGSPGVVLPGSPGVGDGQSVEPGRVVGAAVGSR